MSLNDFITLSKIGQGAYSSVHRVKRISDDTIYALKKVKMNSLKQKQKQNALNQVRLLASITNQYIIGYKEAFFDSKSNCLCIVMQHADGGDLQKYIQKRKKSLQWVPQSQVWKVIKQISTGLCVLHQMKIIHRDLKSANIFKCGTDYRLGDLNVSKLMKKGLAYTQTGTPYYASPEVWKDQPYQLKSDIWSLGCIIYELCALKPPFTASSMEGLYKRVLKGTYPRIPHAYTKNLQDFISKCLKQDPKERPSAKELLKMIPERDQDAQIKSTINLLNTIKLPINLKSLREQLPKSKYQNQGSVQTDKNHESSSRFQNVSQQRLKQIVKLKRQQLSRLKQKKRVTPNLQIIQKIRQSRQVHDSLKKNQKTEVLPKLKLHSQPNDQIHIVKAKQDDRIKRYLIQYNHNRPSWWG